MKAKARAGLCFHWQRDIMNNECWERDQMVWGHAFSLCCVTGGTCRGEGDTSLSTGVLSPSSCLF